MKTRHPYFHSADRVQVLLNQIHLWQGTRWRHAGVRPNQMKCGVHADCLFWVPLFKSIGAFPANLEIPPYRQQEAAGDEMTTLRLKMMETGRAAMVYEHEHAKHLPIFRVGDVLLFTNGMSGAHCGLVVKEAPLHFLHLSGNGLLEEPFLQAHYIAGLRYVYRLLEPEVEG